MLIFNIYLHKPHQLKHICMTKNNTPLWGVMALLSIGFVGFLIYFFINFSSSQIAYVNNDQLFTNFNMSKDLRKINISKVNLIKKKMDSLYTLHTIFKEQSNEIKAKELEILLLQSDKELKEVYTNFSTNIQDQIRTRINQYVQDYGTLAGYKIILGIPKNSAIVYTREDIDITQNVLQFINNKYEGRRSQTEFQN